MLTERRRPKRLEDMVGNEDARTKLAAWLTKWKAGSKAALLVGPPGTGKTTLVHLLSEKHGLNLVELNASDSRTKQKLSRKLGEILTSTNLFGERTLIFLDEVDGLAGRADYGAVEFIRGSVRASENPIVMAANNPDADEVKKLASVATRIEFEPPSVNEVLVYLRRVAEEEGLAVEDGRLFAIAESAKGDIRYALNALQSGLAGGKDEELTAAKALDAFFEAAGRRKALEALRAYPAQPRDKLRDILASVSRAKLPEEKRARALEVLSRADVLMGRIIRGGNWRLLRYLDALLASDLKVALSGEVVRFTTDGVPWMLQLRIWNDSKKIKEMGDLAGRRLGISRKGWAVEDFPYIARLCADKGFREELVRSLNLDEPFESFLAKESVRKVGTERSSRR
ncbi:MAG: AAA family ATPase [Nitrososphaerales archaeon]|nr:AAA family ATPase [Nitrososphaerales archaeon]